MAYFVVFLSVIGVGCFFAHMLHKLRMRLFGSFSGKNVDKVEEIQERKIDNIQQTRSGLLISRKLNESLMIGDKIQVEVVEIHEDKVKLEVKSSQGISVHRKEVYDNYR